MKKLKPINKEELQKYPHSMKLLKEVHKNLDKLLEWTSSKGFVASSQLLLNQGANIEVAQKYGTKEIQIWLKEKNGY